MKVCLAQDVLVVRALEKGTTITSSASFLAFPVTSPAAPVSMLPFVDLILT